MSAWDGAGQPAASSNGQTVRRAVERTRQPRGPDDGAVASIYWGDDWGYDVPEPYVQFVHSLTLTPDADSRG